MIRVGFKIPPSCPDPERKPRSQDFVNDIHVDKGTAATK